MSIEAKQCAPISATEDETWAAVEVIIKAVASDSPLFKALQTIHYNGFYIGKMIRSIKTGWQCQLQNNSPSTVPEIVLCGKWLQHKGFSPGNQIWVFPFSELLIVIPQESKQTF